MLRNLKPFINFQKRLSGAEKSFWSLSRNTCSRNCALTFPAVPSRLDICSAFCWGDIHSVTTRNLYVAYEMHPISYCTNYESGLDYLSEIEIRTRDPTLC